MVLKPKKKYRNPSDSWGVGRDRCGHTGCQSCKS